MVRFALAFAAFALIASEPVRAQDGKPDSENGRYTLSPVAEGLIRLDGRTGQVSLCANRGGGWACHAVPDERAAFESEIGRLQDENATLKKHMLARGVPLPEGMTGGRPPASSAGAPALRLPTDAEIDQMMGFFEKVWRRLVEVVQKAQREMDKNGG